MAIAPIVIEFMTKGTPDVARAFRSVQDVLVRGERESTRASQQASRERSRTATQEARDKIRAMQSADRMVARARAQGVREAEQAARAESRAAERGAREKVRSMERADREIARARERGLREAEQAARAEARAFDRSEREKNASAMKWVRKRERETDTRRDRFASGVLGTGARTVGGIARGAVNAAKTVLSVGGGFSIADSVQREVGLRGQAAQISASTSIAGGPKFTTDQILGTARAAGAAQGFDPSEVLRGIDEMKNLTGDLRTALQMAPDLAKLANASGSDIGELGQLAGNISMADPKASREDINARLRVFTKQGQVGGVEVKDMAKFGARLTAGASLFGGDKSENLASMGAIAQVARQHGGAASPAEATLAAQRFATDVQKHASDLEASGIKVRDGKGTIRDVKGIMGDMLTKSGGDVTKLTKFGLGERGVRALTGFADIYRDAGGGEKGKKAVMDEWGKYTSGVSGKAVDDAANARVSEVDKQLTISMNELRDAVGMQLLPEFVKLVPVIRDSVPHVQALLQAFISMAAWAERNPIQAAFIGLGAIAAKTVAQELIAAKLGDVIKSILGGGKGVPGGGGGGVVVPAVAAGVASGAVITKALLGYNVGSEQADDYAAKLRAYQNGDKKRGMSPEQVQKEIDAAKDRLNKGTVFENTANLTNSLLGDENASKAYGQYKSDQGLTDSKALQEQLAATVAALKANTDATRINTQNTGGLGGSGTNPNNRRTPIFQRNNH